MVVKNLLIFRSNTRALFIDRENRAGRSLRKDFLGIHVDVLTVPVAGTHV